MLAAHELPLNVYPASQLAQIDIPCMVQLAPVAPFPLVQLQVFAKHDLSLCIIHPVLQLPQIAAPLEVQLAPVAATPLLHVQVFALHEFEFR